MPLAVQQGWAIQLPLLWRRTGNRPKSPMGLAGPTGHEWDKGSPGAAHARWPCCDRGLMVCFCSTHPRSSEDRALASGARCGSSSLPGGATTYPKSQTNFLLCSCNAPWDMGFHSRANIPPWNHYGFTFEGSYTFQWLISGRRVSSQRRLASDLSELQKSKQFAGSMLDSISNCTSFEIRP